MLFFRLKAVKALVLAGIVGGLVVSCESGVVNKALPSEEAASDKSVSVQKDASYLRAEKYVNEQISLLKKQAKPLNPEYVRSIDRYSEAVSRTVAAWLANPNAQQQLFSACMERFDGETNVLWNTFDNRVAFSRQIAATAQNVKKSSEPSQMLGSVAEVQKSLAYLQQQAHAPMHLYWAFAQNWDKKTTPLVAYISAGRQKSDIGKPLTGFDAEGNRYEITEAMAKQRPVVVFTINERTTAKGELKTNMITPQNQANVLNDKSVARVQNANRLIYINSMHLDPNANYDEWGNGTYEIFYDVDHEVIGSWGPYYTTRPSGPPYNVQSQRVLPQGNNGIFGQYPLGVTITLHGSNNHLSEYSSAINGYLGVIFRWWEDDTLFSPDGNENDYIFDDNLGWHGTFTTAQNYQPYSGTVSINVSVY